MRKYIPPVFQGVEQEADSEAEKLEAMYQAHPGKREIQLQPRYGLTPLVIH